MTDLDILTNPPTAYWIVRAERVIGIRLSNGKIVNLDASRFGDYTSALMALSASGASFRNSEPVTP